MGKPLVLQSGTQPYPGFCLAQLLGRGGWGQVWRAERAADGKSFALKFLPCDSQMAAPYEVRALQAIKSLSHPHILRVEQIWSCRGYLVIVMELAEGNLHDLLDAYFTELDTALPADHVCYFLAQAAQAIDFLNAKQHLVDGSKVAFRHCDIKPGNLLLVDGKVKVGDFGLAFKTSVRIGPITRSGTLDYAAPEVLLGQFSDRSDQFSLAASYFQLRTGELPFQRFDGGSHVGRSRPPVDLSLLPAAERPILARAFHDVPQARWDSCAELMKRLADCLAKKSVA